VPRGRLRREDRRPDTQDYENSRPSSHVRSLYADQLGAGSQKVLFDTKAGSSSSEIWVGVQCDKDTVVPVSHDESKSFEILDVTWESAELPGISNSTNASAASIKTFIDSGSKASPTAHFRVGGVFEKPSDDPSDRVLGAETGAIVIMILTSLCIVGFCGCFIKWGASMEHQQWAFFRSKIRTTGCAAVSLVVIMLAYIPLMAAMHEDDDAWGDGNSIWWGFVTMTTVGYGDMTVSSRPVAQWFVMFYISVSVLVGAFSLFVLVNATADNVVRFALVPKQLHHECAQKCLHCQCWDGHKDMKYNFAKVGACLLVVVVLIYAAIFYALEQSPCSEFEDKDAGYSDCAIQECKDNNDAWTYTNALYFTVVTLSTVGYGDLSPRNGDSKRFGVIVMVTGVALFAALAGTALEWLKDRVKAAQIKLEDEKGAPQLPSGQSSRRINTDEVDLVDV
jgi:Ion channel